MSPPNQFPISTPGDPHPEYYSSLLEDGGWLPHIPDTDTFRKCGYYIKSIRTTQNKTLKFVVLNTNIYLHDKKAEGADPCAQLSWLNHTIAQADPATELLYIVSHVPPKFQFNTPALFAKEIHSRYMKIITNPENAKKIHAHIYAHYHSDTFEIFLDETGTEARGVAFIGSSVSPVTGVNPGIRLFTIDDVDGTLLDYDQFYLDLQYLSEKFDITQDGENEKDNKTVYVSSSDSSVDNAGAMNSQIGLIKDYVSHPSFTKHYTVFLAKKWKLLYKATEAFAIPRLSKDYMLEAFASMVESGVNGSIFSDYCAHRTLGHGDGSGCGEAGWREMLCTVTSRGAEDQGRCLNGTDKNTFPGFKSTKVMNESNIIEITIPSHGDDIDNNDIFIVISAIVFIFVVSLMMAVLYYHHQREVVEDTEQVLLTDSDFQYGGLSVEYE